MNQTEAALPRLSPLALVYEALFIGLGAGAGLTYLLRSEPLSWGPLLSWALLAMVVAWFRMGFPSPQGTFSLEWVCVLAALASLGGKAAVIIAILAVGLKQYRRYLGGESTGLFFRIHLIFVLAVNVLAVRGGEEVLLMMREHMAPAGLAASLPLAAMAVFACLELPRASAMALVEGRRLLEIWREESLWMAPYHLAGAALAGLALTLAALPPWVAALAGLLVIALLFRSFRAYLGSVEKERKRAAEVTALNVGMLEALAMAVEARESGGQPNLHRMGATARLLGEALKLPEEELRALEVAAILHDMGKLAVPDYILTKPGRLQPEEFDRLKLHPIIAAEIVERAQIGFAVAPMIRAHHERWDGAGYPDGLSGSRIPRGARILAVVDALDALLSERKYRRALPLRRAIEAIARDAGAAYDPAIVDALRSRATELERLLKSTETSLADPPGFVAAIADAHREEQQIQGLLQHLSASLDLEKTLGIIEDHLRRLVPHEVAVVWLEDQEGLVAIEAIGRERPLFDGRRLPAGAGATGRSAAARVVLAGEAAAEEVRLAAGSGVERPDWILLAVPFVTEKGVAGVFSVYGGPQCQFHTRHARVLSAFAPRFVSWLDSARRYQKAEEQASHDALTGLPNAATLYLQLQQEIARNNRAGKRLAVLVCDLDGFKGVNDVHGHLAGNQVLQLVAAGLRGLCREYDFVARMGGDEFVILLPGLGDDPIDDRIQNFSAAVREAGIQVCGHAAISLSVGAAFSPADGLSPDELLARSDQRMYVNKRLRKSRGGVPPDTAHAIFLTPEV